MFERGHRSRIGLECSHAALRADPFTEQFSVEADIRSYVPNDISGSYGLFKNSLKIRLIFPVQLQSCADLVNKTVQSDFSPD